MKNQPEDRMMSSTDFSRTSYQAHEHGYDAYTASGPKSSQAAAWLKAGTVNHWRFERMYRLADPVLEIFPGATWLTVGDGRYGLDAQYLIAHGAEALPTDISVSLLAEAKAQAAIADYRKENAESLSFADESFDFVLCKESYHHFPRPMVALHEMIRVARYGVLLIEPNDQEFPDSFATTVSRILKNMIKKLLGRSTDGHRFEEIGNYVYGISRREIEKVALGMGLPIVAFRGLNDYYLPGVEFAMANDDDSLFRKVRARIARYDLFCKLGISQYGLLGALILKGDVNPELLEQLKRAGFGVVSLPRSPALTPKRSAK
jgi:ubiquinone/menaquinone biosynthesis C-methylase UbiE